MIRTALLYSLSGTADLLDLLQKPPAEGLTKDSKYTKYGDGTIRACREPEEAMLKLNIDNIGDLAIVECEGRIVQSEAAFKLRDAVTSQCQASTVVVELSEVQALEGGGLRR